MAAGRGHLCSLTGHAAGGTLRGRLSPQDGRADVVANDAGDRVTPAVVAFSESEEVRVPVRGGGREGRGVLPGAYFFALFFFFLYFSFRLLA